MQLLGSLRARVADRWLRVEPAERTRLLVLLLAIVGCLAHYIIVWCWIQPFYIEDSAISFTYARNFVDGLGLVAYPGGEHVEGFSNALWTFLIAGLLVVGVPVWTSAKLLGGFFGALTLPYVYGIGKRILPDEPRYAGYALIAPWLLAASAQFNLWNSSGLENSLFCFTLAGATYWLDRETEEGLRTPWSALHIVALLLTRPDGMAYAAIAAFARILAGVWRRQWVATFLWLVAVVVPFGAFEAWRLSYFAWPFPNTYYAKDRNWQPFNWSQAGWTQIRNWNWNYGVVWAIPAMMWAVLGTKRWRWGAVVAACAILVGLIAWDGKAGISPSMRNAATEWLGRDWVKLRVWTIVGFAVLLGLGAFGRKGWVARGMLWASYAAGYFFVVYAQGDWMKAFRWFSLTSVPTFTLVGGGIGLVADALPAGDKVIRRIRLGWVYVAAPTIALMAANIPNIQEFVLKPETMPRDVHRRVDYMKWVQSRLGLDHVTLMDVDMGATMWWSGWEIVDMAGLIDVPVAHHNNQRAFWNDYLFNERRPDFAHVHGSWGNTTKIPRLDDWKDDYIEIPGYPAGAKTLHIGNHVRRDILARDKWEGPAGRTVRFASRVRMEGWDLPSPTIAPGGELQVNSVWRVKDRKDGFRVLLFLSSAQGEVVWTGEVVPGYDWLPVEEWGPLDYVAGNWGVSIPASVPQGTYDLGIVVLDAVTGRVLPVEGLGPGGEVPFLGDPDPLPPEEPLPPQAPVYMTGEWRIAGAVQLVSPEEAQAAAKADADAAITAAKSGDCDAAETDWHDAVEHVAKNTAWIDKNQPAVDAARVDCLVDHAEAEKADLARPKWLRKARWIDPTNARLLAYGAEVGGVLEAAGDVSRGKEDWDTAWYQYIGALTADPTRAWARRYAEEARDHRLGIDDPKGPDKSPAKPEKKAPTKPVIKPKTPPKPPADAPKPDADAAPKPDADAAPEPDPTPEPD